MTKEEFVKLRIDDMIYDEEGRILKLTSQFVHPNVDMENRQQLSVEDAFGFRSDIFGVFVGAHDKWSKFDFNHPSQMPDKVAKTYLVGEMESLKRRLGNLRTI